MIRFAEIKVLAEYVGSDSPMYLILAAVEYSFYGLGITVSTISMVYHLAKRFKGKKVSEKGMDNSG